MTYSSKFYGSIVKAACPVCGGKNFANEWKIPMTTIDPPAVLFGGYFNQVPTLRSPFTIYGFDLCKDCECVFLNPDIPRENQINSYKKSTHYIKKMENKDEWRGYVDRYEMISKYFQPDAKSILDAASGLGQVALLAKDDKKTAWQRISALELSAAYVKHMNENGVEAYEFDIDFDPIENFFKHESIDFVVFFEAFEHVSFPTKALEKLFWTVRPGGRLFFSAQRYGPDVDLAIRPGEPIYIGEKYINSLGERLSCEVLNVMGSGSRYYVVIEKPGGPKRATPPTETPKPTPTQPKGKEIALTSTFTQEVGNCWVADLRKHCPDESEYLLSIADTDNAGKRSHLQLIEKNGANTKELGPSHTLHANVRSAGNGAFSHWKESLYFATSDNSDPNTNGRSYYIVI